MIIEVKRFRRMDDSGKLKGYADVTFEDAITVRGIRLMEGQYGMFAAMPSRKETDGEYHEIVVLADRVTREALGNALVREYQKSMWTKPDRDCDPEEIFS